MTCWLLLGKSRAKIVRLQEAKNKPKKKLKKLCHLSADVLCGRPPIVVEP